MWTDGLCNPDIFQYFCGELWECPECYKLFWANRKSEEFPFGDLDSPDSEAYGKRAGIPDANQLFNAIRQRFPQSLDELRQFRIMLLWRTNNPVRFQNDEDIGLDSGVTRLSERARDNAIQLYRMLDPAVEWQRLLMGEIMREMRYFVEACALLNPAEFSGLSSTATFIHGLVRESDCLVRQLPDDD